MTFQLPKQLTVLYSFPHVLDRPGIAVTALHQVLELAKRGIAVELFCASLGTAELPSSVRVHTTLSAAGLRVPHRALGVQNAYSLHDARVALWLKRHSSSVDLVHAWPRGCIRTLNAARQAGIPALRESPNPHTASVMRDSALAARDARVELPRDHSHAASRSVLSREQAEYDAADFVLVPSDYALSEFLTQGLPSGKLLRHRYGCDLDRFPARTAGRLPGTPFRMCFVGRGDPTKGLHVALEAWRAASLADARFVIAGKLEESYAESLRDRLVDPRIAVRGFVDDVGALLSGSDVLLLPSSTEGSALVVYEAQATGCVPLVSAASGAFGEAGRHFLVHSVGDVERLASQMRTLAQDPDLLERLSGNCVADRDLFSWSAAGTALMECYEKALAGAPREAGVSEGMAG